jgi:signal peptidase I
MLLNLKKVSFVLLKIIKYYSVYYTITNYLIPIDLVILNGTSMQPTLNDFDVVLVEKKSVRERKLKK